MMITAVLNTISVAALTPIQMAPITICANLAVCMILLPLAVKLLLILKIPTTYAQFFADNTVNVSADKMIYAIFDRSKQCSVDNIGCSRLGKGENPLNNYFQ